MPATIYDVADQAGVSVATVSRIVNGTGKVSVKTTEKVNDAIKVLNFTPNALGQSLSKAKARIIGVVIPSMSNPVFADAMAGVNEVARQNGITLMVTMTEYDADIEETVINSLLSYRPEGLILTLADPDRSEILRIIDKQDIPHILIYNQPTLENHRTVTVDNIRAGGDVARHFLSQGHRHLGMLSGSFDKSDRAEARWKGFSDAAISAGLDRPTLFEIDFVEPDIANIVGQFKEGSQKMPTALFCSNDLLAISAMNAFIRAGFRVPEDLAIIGFDGIGIGTQIHPSLATVVQPSREMGREAMKALLSQISGEAISHSIILPHALREGESAGSACKPEPADSLKPT